MITLTHCRDDGSGCISFYPEQAFRIKKMAPVQNIRKIDPTVLDEMREIRDSLIAIKKELPAYLRKQKMAAIMKDPARLAKLSASEIEVMFPRDQEE